MSARAQRVVRHGSRGIAQVYDTGKIDAVVYLAMELVDGQDLSALLSRGPMPPADVLPIAKQIALALDAAHEQGIVHRELKPANIKVRADGMVKVLDFGLAKALESHDAGSATAMNSPTLTNRATRRMRLCAAAPAPASPWRRTAGFWFMWRIPLVAAPQCSTSSASTASTSSRSMAPPVRLHRSSPLTAAGLGTSRISTSCAFRRLAARRWVSRTRGGSRALHGSTTRR